MHKRPKGHFSFFDYKIGMNKPNFRTINRFRSEKLTDGRFESVANIYTFVGYN